MVIKTRGGGKRKDNPTKEEVRKVKFVKTASDNIEKTTTENVESTGTAKATEIVDSREKTTDVSTEVTTDVSTEKTSEDARESTAEITEPSDVALETAPATVNKGPAGPSPPAPPATPAIGTESEEEENEETPSSGDEENQKAGSGEEENDHDDRSDVSLRSRPISVRMTPLANHPLSFKLSNNPPPDAIFSVIGKSAVEENVASPASAVCKKLAFDLIRSTRLTPDLWDTVCSGVKTDLHFSDPDVTAAAVSILAALPSISS
ncbi:hypothetical protein F2Q70_00026258 [Brassica cretica]|uniref:Uncharacterized protein n=1 Tax=Brassica cretica TaxID=69181 RepID=A0A8S9L5T7_BRACR|nr:hypothetical protein F2Q70_00026258 [Brassica cretica]